jgi:colicin import membrane protein
MSRFEKKCFIGSAAFHGLLLVVFLFGSAFFNSDKLINVGPVVNILNARTTDEAKNTGGNPNATPTPPQARPQPPETKPEPPPPKAEPVKPEPVKIEPKREPIKAEPLKLKQPDPKPVVRDRKPEPKKDAPKEVVTTKPSISKTLVHRTNDVAALERERAEQARKEKERREQQEAWNRYNEQRNRIARQVGSLVGDVAKNLGHSTVVQTAGPGGEAFVNYGSWVREVYERAWHVTPELMEDDSSALARVTIRRDGSVARATLSEKSRNTSLNRSVQQALDRVTDIGKPFPEGAKEPERTFTIEFNLKTRKAIG